MRVEYQLHVHDMLIKPDASSDYLSGPLDFPAD